MNVEFLSVFVFEGFIRTCQYFLVNNAVVCRRHTCRLCRQSVEGQCLDVLSRGGKYVNLLKPTGCVMHQQFNIQQLCALPTLYLCVLCLSENKQRLVPLTA